MLATQEVTQFLDSVSSGSPAPGGGSASALSGAMGAALAAMVCRLTIGKKKYESVQDDMIGAVGALDELRAKMTSLIDQDTEAFNDVMDAFRLPKETAEQKQVRSAAIQEATRQATLVPLDVMRFCEQTLVIATMVAEKGNVNSISDVGVAALLLKAGCEGAAYNVRINLATLVDKEFVADTSTMTAAIETNVEALSDGIRKRVTTVLS